MFMQNFEITLESFVASKFSNIDSASNGFIEVVTYQSKQNISASATKHYSPSFNRHMKSDVQTRNLLEHIFPTPNIINIRRKPNKEITHDIRQEQHNKYKPLLKKKRTSNRIFLWPNVLYPVWATQRRIRNKGNHYQTTTRYSPQNSSSPRTYKQTHLMDYMLKQQPSLFTSHITKTVLDI